MRVTALPALVGRARPPATVTTGQRGLPEPEQATPGAAQVDGHVQCLRSVPLDDDREPLEPPGQDQQVPQTDTGTPWHKIPGTDPRHHAPLPAGSVSSTRTQPVPAACAPPPGAGASSVGSEIPTRGATAPPPTEEESS